MLREILYNCFVGRIDCVRRSILFSESYSLALSALAFLALARTVHLATGEHATVVCLQELSGLVERILLLPVVLLLFLNNFVEVLSSTFLLLAFGPLLFYLSELLELIFEISLCLVTLLVLVTHVLIVRFQRLSVLLVRIIVVGQERLLGRLVSALKRSVISSLIIDGSLELSHGLLMAFLASLFDNLSLAHERGLVGVLILSKI